MRTAYRLTGLATLVALYVSAASAAEFKLFRSDKDTEASLIVMRGEILLGDDAKLKELLAGLKTPPLIMLESPGGNLSASLGMGTAIRAAGANTIVDENNLCASGCALAWLGGKSRIAFPTSKIALHAASKGDGGEVTGAGNALIGVYMTRLGLGADAVLFATSAEPSSFNYLTFKTARSLGIEVTNMEELRNRVAVKEKAMGDDDAPSQRFHPRPASSPRPPAPSASASAPERPLTIADVEASLLGHGISLDDARRPNFDRANRAFWKRIREAGTIGIKESITLCHEQARRQRTPKTASYCLGLDATAAILEDALSKERKITPDPFLTIKASVERSMTTVDTAFPMLSKPSLSALQKHWTSLALAAYDDPANRPAPVTRQ